MVTILSLVVGSLFIAPPLAIKYHYEQDGNEFVLAQLKTYRDEVYSYLPRAREVYDGRFPPTDLSLEGYKATPFGSVPPLLLGGLIYVFRGDMNAAYLAAQFIFSAIIFALLYLTGRYLFNSWRWALFFSAVGALTPALINVFNFDFKGDLKILFDYTVKQFVPFVRTQIDKLRLARIDEPLLTYPIYWAAILTFLIFWKKPSVKMALSTAVLSGLLVYTYVHHWIYWTIFIGLTFLYAFWRRGTNQKLFKNYCVLLGFLAIVLLPFFVNFWLFNQNPGSVDASYRFTVFETRELGIGPRHYKDYVAYLILAILVWLAFFKKPRKIDGEDWWRPKEWGVIFLALIGAIVVARNIQVVLGETITPAKWDNAFSPAFFIIFIALIYDFFKRWSRQAPVIGKWSGRILVLLSVLVFAKYAVNPISIYSNPNPETLAYYKFPNEVVDSWRWINNNLESEPKILTPSYVTSMYLMSYTSARPFVPRGLLSLASNFEIEERFLIANKFFQVPPADLRMQLAGEFDRGCSAFDCFPDTGINLNKPLFQLYGGWFENRKLKDFLNDRDLTEARDRKLDELLTRYKNLEADWEKVDIDYIYYGPWEKQLNGGRTFWGNPSLKLVYENTEVQIYKLLNK